MKNLKNLIIILAVLASSFTSVSAFAEKNKVISKEIKKMESVSKKARTTSVKAEVNGVDATKLDKAIDDHNRVLVTVKWRENRCIAAGEMNSIPCWAQLQDDMKPLYALDREVLLLKEKIKMKQKADRDAKRAAKKAERDAERKAKAEAKQKAKLELIQAAKAK